jgi:hypothetical protein
MAEIFFRGGSQIGWVNASWPLAKLNVSRDRLSIASLGEYSFTPGQVVSLELNGSIPILSTGIRVVHNRLDYPEKVIFLCIGNRRKVLEQISQIGFIPKGLAVARPRGFPIQWWVIIAAVVLWNCLFLIDRSFRSNVPGALGPYSFIALLLLFLFSTATRFSESLQHAILRDGHHYGEIKSFLSLAQLVSGVLACGFGISILLGANAG